VSKTAKLVKHSHNAVFNDYGGSSEGGAIYNDSSAKALSITNSIFIANTTLAYNSIVFSLSCPKGGNSEGGAIYNKAANTNLSISGSNFQANSAIGSQGEPSCMGASLIDYSPSAGGNGQGGAIYTEGVSTTLTITTSTFGFNQATGGNGGDAIAPSYHNMSRMEGGGTGAGGGIFALQGSLVLSNLSFNNNTAKGGYGGENFDPYCYGQEGFGGGAYGEGLYMGFGGSSAYLYNITLAYNAAQSGQGGSGGACNQPPPVKGTASSDNLGVDSPNFTITNSIVAYPTSNHNCDGNIGDGGYNLEYPTNSCGFTNHPQDGDPLLIPQQLASTTSSSPGVILFPQTGSPALDNANDAVCAAAPVNAQDIQGATRPNGAHCDIGAVEGSLPTTSSFYSYPLPFLANDSGGGFTTYLAIQNTSHTNPANLQIQYYGVDGNLNGVLNQSGCNQLAALAECLPPNPFATGAAGTGLLISDQPLNVIVAEATPLGGSAYTVREGAATSSLAAPLAINNALGGFQTQLRVFNAGTSTSNVTIRFFDQQGIAQPGATQNLNIAPYTSQTLDQTAASSGLANGFYGWAQITSTVGSTLIAQVLEQNPTTHFVAIASGQAYSSSAVANPNSPSLVYAPAMFREAFGGFTTGANLLNPGATPLIVTISYYRNDGVAYPTPAFSLAPHSIAPFIRVVVVAWVSLLMVAYLTISMVQQ
jgi:hypothetical protein